MGGGGGGGGGEEDVDQDAGGAEDEEREKIKEARESSKFSSQLLTGHAAPGTLVKVLRPLQLQHFSRRFFA